MQSIKHVWRTVGFESKRSHLKPPEKSSSIFSFSPEKHLQVPISSHLHENKHVTVFLWIKTKELRVFRFSLFPKQRTYVGREIPRGTPLDDPIQSMDDESAVRIRDILRPSHGAFREDWLSRKFRYNECQAHEIAKAMESDGFVRWDRERERRDKSPFSVVLGHRCRRGHHACFWGKTDQEKNRNCRTNGIHEARSKSQRQS